MRPFLCPAESRAERFEMETQVVEAAESAALQQYNGPETSTSALVLNEDSFNSMMRVAEVMSTGKSTIPTHLRSNPGDCMAVIMQAMQWKMNPFAVAQKTHVVNGALGYEAQLVNAVIQSSGFIDGRFFYEYQGEGQAVQCRVGAVIRGEKEVTWGEWLSAATVTTKNSPLWKTNPKQQLGYLQVKNWSRLYCPGAILGVYTPEELIESAPRERDVTPKTATGYAEKAKPSGEQTPEAIGFIARLEAIANTGNMEALTQEFGAIGKPGRVAVGVDEWARIRAICEQHAPIEGESTEEQPA